MCLFPEVKPGAAALGRRSPTEERVAQGQTLPGLSLGLGAGASLSSAVKPKDVPEGTGSGLFNFCPPLSASFLPLGRKC